MRYLFIFLTCCLACNPTNKGSQVTKETTQPYRCSTDSLISRLPSMKADTLKNMLQNCDAGIYWKIVKRGQASIPLLIKSLTDTTLTNIYDPAKKGKLNIGELSYYALDELSEFPVFFVTHLEYETVEAYDCKNFYTYFYDNRNKPAYQADVETFYREHKYVFRAFSPEEKNVCRQQYGITGKYYLSN
jgi:hypothetical protein